MDLVALVRPSDGFYPGHMVIGEETEANPPRYFGFHFDLHQLPEEHRPEERWEEFFYSNKILGEIRDDSDLVALWRASGAIFYEKRVACGISIDTQIPPRTDWRSFAYYSFRPDDFHSETSPCYNCVTWATMIANKLVPGFLMPVEQGRIKHVLRQFRADVEETGGTDE